MEIANPQNSDWLPDTIARVGSNDCDGSFVRDADRVAVQMDWTNQPRRDQPIPSNYYGRSAGHLPGI